MRGLPQNGNAMKIISIAAIALSILAQSGMAADKIPATQYPAPPRVEFFARWFHISAEQIFTLYPPGAGSSGKIWAKQFELNVTPHITLLVSAMPPNPDSLDLKWIKDFSKTGDRGWQKTVRPNGDIVYSDHTRYLLLSHQKDWNLELDVNMPPGCGGVNLSPHYREERIDLLAHLNDNLRSK